MCKLKTTILCIAAFFMLLTIGSCNFPSLAPAGDSPTLEVPVDVEPTAPANTDAAETIRIPGGTFAMGSAESDLQAAEDERPVHEVTVGTFYLYTHEVTNEMYTACVDAGVCLPVNVMDTGPTTHTDDIAYANYPVTGVDWNMARDYCTWAGSRLPTEAEWEYAARGTESLLHPWGTDEADCNRTNMFGCLVPPDVVEVGSYLLGNSPFDVWDMAGNVWEWVNDWYADGYYALSPTANPLGPYSYQDTNNPLKVVRGGGLYSGPEQMRSADRAGTNPYRAYDDIGFRCVAEGEALPEEYTETRDRHEMVPPDALDGGGEMLDDPDEESPYASMGTSSATCPDAEGLITIYLEAETSEAGEYSATVEDVPFDCSYNPAASLLTCTGSAPAATEYPGLYHVRIYFPGGGVIGHQYPEIPTDCPADALVPLEASASASCPGEDGLVTIDFTFSPPINWDIGQYVDYSRDDAPYTEMPCVQISETSLRCTLPANAAAPGSHHYSVYLHGYGAAGETYHLWTIASMPDDCPDVLRGTNVTSFCFEGQPTVHISFVPEDISLASVSTVGVPLGCIGMTPVDQFCGPLVGSAGSSIPITTCFEGETCEDWTVTVPDCSGPASAYLTSVIPTCYAGLGPVVVIHYAPADQPLVAANANGADLSCIDAPEPGWYMCSGIPGTPGSEMTISYCLADGTCFSEPITVSDCGVVGWNNDWRLIAVACTADVTQISFMVDTYLEWLTPTADFTYTASDGETTYGCSVHPTVAGRVYCAGPRPESPGNLEFCIQRDGEAAPTCETFDIYPGWVAETPACGEEPVTEEPAVVDPCSVHTDAVSCNMDKTACHWIYADPQHCVSNP